MNYKILEAEYDGLLFRIEEDNPEVGVYLYVFKEKNCLYDYLQNTINICINQALEQFGVPIEQWKEVDG